jgi:hypothetical protein
VPEFHTKFWFKADAVVSAESSSEAWKRVAQIATNLSEGHHGVGVFHSGGMSMVPDGQHLVEPMAMNQVAEDALVALFVKNVMDQGASLELEEMPDHTYSMIIGFALAHNLRPEDAKKLAQRLYHGQADQLLNIDKKQT